MFEGIKKLAVGDVLKDLDNKNAAEITHYVTTYKDATNMAEGIGSIKFDGTKKGFACATAIAAAAGSVCCLCKKISSKRNNNQIETQTELENPSGTYSENIIRINQALEKGEKPDINDVCEVYYYNGNDKKFLYGYTHEELTEAYERHLAEKNIH